jgi:hypothetical protein
MSRCLTLTHTGLTDGIRAIGSENYPSAVWLGDDFERHYFSDDEESGSTLCRHSTVVRLHADHPPVITLVDGEQRIHAASVMKGSDGRPLIRTGPLDQRGILVYLDTSHTEPCTTGGRWKVLRGNPSVVAEGRRGHRLYKVRYRNGDPFHYAAEPVEEVDTSTSYACDLVLLMPGDQMEVTFHAPGKVVGVLTYVSPKAGLKFNLTVNEPDENYVYEVPDYQDEADLNAYLAERTALSSDW